MEFDIQNALTNNDCTTAITLSTLLYNSQYSDNTIRMLFASSQGCNVGIQLYPLITSLGTANFSTPDNMFKSMVQLFPSQFALDSKEQSTLLMQDALQSILNPATVVGAPNQVVANAFNIGSDLTRDHTPDANAFLVFTAMAGVGTNLNRNGYVAGDNPAALAFAPDAASALFAAGTTWNTKARIKADTTQQGCALASSLYNMFDAIAAVSNLTAGPIKQAFGLIGLVQSLIIDPAGLNQCTTVDGFTAQQCADAAIRLRFRGACLEQDPAASWAAGVIIAITNPATGWN